MILAAGLALLQALIGGRGLLFAYPGYGLIGIAGLVGFAFAYRSKASPDWFCLYGTIIFLGYVLVRALASDGYVARPDVFSALGALTVYGLTVSALTSAKARLAVISVLLTFALVHVFIGMIQFSRGDNYMLIPFLQRVDYGPRASGFYVCPNHLAGLLEVLGIFGVSLTCWGRWPIWAKLVTAYATVACYAGVALTASRGGYLSVIASGLCFAVLSILVVRVGRPEKWGRFALIATAAILITGLTGTALIHQSGYLSQRTGNIIDTRNMRVDLWRAAIKQWHLQPIIGTGSGTYRFYGRQFRTEQMQYDPIDVHNDYLHLLCEYGLIGLAGFLIFISVHLRQGWRAFRHIASTLRGRLRLLSNRLALTIGALCAIASYTVHSAFDFNLHIPANAMLLAFVAGIIGGPAVDRNPAVSRVPRMLILGALTAIFAAVILIQSFRLFSGELYAEQARTALRDEDPATSIILAQKALVSESQNPDIFFYLSRALVAVGNKPENSEQRPQLFEQAIAALENAQRLAPMDGSYPLNLAFLYDESARYREAEWMYGVAHSRDPHSAAVLELYRAHINSWRRAGLDDTSK